MDCTVEEIRAKYPNPVAAYQTPDYGDCYCVGGAFIRACVTEHGMNYRRKRDVYHEALNNFPSKGRLALNLEKVNSHLSWEAAYLFANDIVKANDKGNFELAWQNLEHALNFS